MVSVTLNPPLFCYRSYILDALDMAIETVNGGIALLADEKPTDAHYKRVLAVQGDLREALQIYSQVRVHVNLCVCVWICVVWWRGSCMHVLAVQGRLREALQIYSQV